MKQMTPAWTWHGLDGDRTYCVQWDAWKYAGFSNYSAVGNTFDPGALLLNTRTSDQQTDLLHIHHGEHNWTAFGKSWQAICLLYIYVTTIVAMYPKDEET